MNFWQSMAAVGIGMSGVLVSVIIGGWLVFRAKTITMPAQFFNPAKPSQTKSSNYVPNSLNEFSSQPEPEISPAAARLRAQKLGEKDAVMAIVKGAAK